jgi:hypothetical protein
MQCRIAHARSDCAVTDVPRRFCVEIARSRRERCSSPGTEIVLVSSGCPGWACSPSAQRTELSANFQINFHGPAWQWRVDRACGVGCVQQPHHAFVRAYCAPSMQPPPTAPKHWSKLLRTISEPALAGFPTSHAEPAAIASATADFRDESGHRRAVDAPFLAAALGVPHNSDTPTARLDLRSQSAPAIAWSAIANDDAFPIELHKLIERVVASAAIGLSEADARLLTGSQNATSGSQSLGIEPVTEALLCLCDAAWRSQDARNSYAMLRDHLLAEYQPDNATSRPWAIGVFLEDWCRAGRPESLMYADGMLTACRVQMGRPDRLSAVILRFAAEHLDRDGA